MSAHAGPFTSSTAAGADPAIAARASATTGITRSFFTRLPFLPLLHVGPVIARPLRSVREGTAHLDHDRLVGDPEAVQGPDERLPVELRLGLGARRAPAGRRLVGVGLGEVAVRVDVRDPRDLHARGDDLADVAERDLHLD